MSATKNNARELLAAIGIGQFQATMVIQYMMVPPATTDPKAPQIILLVRQIQKALFGLGATDVPDSGHLDPPTAAALETLVGPGWERQPWFVSVAAVAEARKNGTRMRAASGAIGPSGAPRPVVVRADTNYPGELVSVGGPLDFLPDVPGGMFTYAIGGFLLFKLLRKH